MKIKDRFDDLPPAKKTQIKKFATIGAVVLFSVVAYYGTGRNEKAPPPPGKETDLKIGTGLLEDDIKTKVDQTLAEKQLQDQLQDKKTNELTRQLEELQLKMEKQLGIKDSQAAAAANDVPPDYAAGGGSPVRYPPPPPPPPPASSVDYANTVGAEGFEPEVIGGIGHSSGAPQQKSGEGSKKNKVLELPPGFMEGTLLTGIEADALGSGEGAPEPIMFRIDSPAILPNRIKADLEGCFVVASATGEINKERVGGRLVSLHCVKKNGKGAVYGDVKGFVADQDGMKGMAGIVVSKGGPLLLRGMVAGAITGLGKNISHVPATTTITGAGALQTFDSESAARSALGEGVSSGAEQYNEIIVDYIRQTTPVIQVGAQKKVTICIIEPVKLTIVEDSGE